MKKYSINIIKNYQFDVIADNYSQAFALALISTKEPYTYTIQADEKEDLENRED